MDFSNTIRRHSEAPEISATGTRPVANRIRDRIGNADVECTHVIVECADIERHGAPAVKHERPFGIDRSHVRWLRRLDI